MMMPDDLVAEVEQLLEKLVDSWACSSRPDWRPEAAAIIRKITFTCAEAITEDAKSFSNGDIHRRLSALCLSLAGHGTPGGPIVDDWELT